MVINLKENSIETSPIIVNLRNVSDERTTNCNNVANGGNANFKSQNIKRNKKVNDECVWDFDLCECLDDDPPQALIDQAQADCLGEPFRDKDNGCNWDFKDIGCNDNIAGGGQTKKDCKKQN